MSVPDAILIDTYVKAQVTADRFATEVICQQRFMSLLPEKYQACNAIVVAKRLIRLRKDRKLPKLGRE